jgi:hypothetical protein
MTRDSDQEIDAKAEHDWRWRVRWYKASTYQFMVGFGVSMMGGSILNGQRPGWIPSPWKEAVDGAFFIAWGWFLWVTFPHISQLNSSEPSSSSGRKTLLALALVGTFLARWGWDQVWAVICLGPFAAVVLWHLGTVQRSKPYVAVAIWVIAGAPAMLLPWPNPQRFLAVLMAGGAATALQGVFAFFQFKTKMRHAHAECRSPQQNA